MLTKRSTEYNPQGVEERFNFILSKLRGVSVQGNVAKARCPAHEDETPSLQVNISKRFPDQINVKCYVGCDLNSILGAIGLNPTILYPPEKQKTSSLQVVSSGKPRIDKVYGYLSGNGRHAFHTARMFPKDFRITKNVNLRKWKGSMKDVKMVPYNLPAVLKGIKKKKPIVFVEGEKDVDNGIEMGVTCTTVAGGNGKWRDEYAQYFRKADVVCIADNDEPGINGMLRIARKLGQVAARVRFLILPVKHKGDLTDWIEDGGDFKQFWELVVLRAAFLNEAMIVDRMNESHAVIMVQGQFVIINEEYNPTFKRKDITLSSKGHFVNRYENQPVMVTKLKRDKKAEQLIRKTEELTEKNNQKKKKIYKEELKMLHMGQLWIKSPHRRQHNGFTFQPDIDKKQVDGYYNLWKGFAVKKVEGDCSLYKQHIWEVIANHDKEIYTYILDWMADAVQNRAQRPGVAMVLRGGSGAGKGTMIDIFGKLFGQHYIHVSNAKHIVGNFNAHLKDCLILFGDEAFYANDKEHESVLKTLITEPTRILEYKGKDAMVMPNYTRLMMASNKTWVVPVEMDDRRFFIIDVSGKKSKDHDYFDKIYRQMNEEGGNEALLHMLKKRDISKSNLKDFPITEAILDNKLESMETMGQWIYYMLCDNDFTANMEMDPIKKLHEEYKIFCGRNWPASFNAFTRKIKKFFPEMRTYQRSGEPRRYYKFPPLDECRKQFEAIIRIKIDWEQDAASEE